MISAPNSTPVPNDFLDEHMPDMAASELKVALVLFRRTANHWGTDWIPLSINFLINGTGMSRHSVISGADALVQRGLAERSEVDGTAAYRLVVEGGSAKIALGGSAKIAPNSTSTSTETLSTSSTKSTISSSPAQKRREPNDNEKFAYVLAEVFLGVPEEGFYNQAKGTQLAQRKFAKTMRELGYSISDLRDYDRLFRQKRDPRYRSMKYSDFQDWMARRPTEVEEEEEDEVYEL